MRQKFITDEILTGKGGGIDPPEVQTNFRIIPARGKKETFKKKQAIVNPLNEEKMVPYSTADQEDIHISQQRVL